MSLFKQREQVLDLSTDLHDSTDWKPGKLRLFEYALNVTTLAIEPISGLLAIGTTNGTIHLLGRPGVEWKLWLPEARKIVSLQLPSSVYKVVCLDDHGELHVWDLSAPGAPKYQSSARFTQATSLAVSPYHSHAFVTLQSGEIKTYDLVCLRRSQYVVPNLWTLYEEKMAASGVSEVSTPTSGIALDVVAHPRNLNLLFIVYGGGVVLSDLTEKKTLRVYELVLPPGAQGGAGYGAPDILTPRRPEATSISIHPAGHFFAVGYSDGCIAFWAIDDEDQPLLVRTMDDMEVNMVDAAHLEELMVQAKAEDPSSREPIFRLSWCSFPNSSDPRGGETALVVLGGLNSDGSSGVTAFWLPPFNPAAPAIPNTSSDIDPVIRAAMRTSLEPITTYFYYSDGLVQDYLLVPRSSPLFSGADDPIAVLVVREGPRQTRVVEGFQFPPPLFTTTGKSEDDAPSTPKEGSRDALTDLQTTLESMQLSEDARSLILPGFLSNGASVISDGLLRRLTRDAYANLAQDSLDLERNLPLRAGFAYLSTQNQGEVTLSKYQPPRILITSHSNLTVQMWDVSTTLLTNARPEPIQYDFPNHLSRLALDLNLVLTDARVAPRLRYSGSPLISSVELASQSLDCSVALSGGEIIVYRLRSAHDLEHTEDLPDKELVSLRHLSNIRESKYLPVLLVDAQKGATTATALADIGPLAVCYQDGSLLVVDTNSPQVILRTNAKEQSSGLHFGHADPDQYVSLLWTICPMSTDRKSRPRLIAAKASGTSHTFTFEEVPSNHSWKHTGEPVKVDTASQPIPGGLFVIEAKNGGRCLADRTRLRSPSDGHVLLVSLGAKGARCLLDVNGDRIGKTDWSTRAGPVLSAQIVEKLRSFALVVFTAHNEALVFSLPNLEFLHNLALPPIRHPLPYSIDESGDYIAWSLDDTTGLIQEATYATLFDFRRVNVPSDVILSTSVPVVPSPPQPVSATPETFLGSWLKIGNQTLTGDQVDVLLGGADRPIPQPPNPAVPAQSSSSPASRAAGQTESTQDTLYNRLTSALQERGQMLGDLEDRFNSLEQGSKSMANQAKRIAAEQTAKSWFRF